MGLCTLATTISFLVLGELRSLVELKLGCLFVAGPLSESILIDCQLDPSSMKFNQRYLKFHTGKCIQKCRMQDSDHHYSDVTMSVVAYQITGISTVCSTRLFRRTSKKTSKLCEGNPPVTDGFPSQRASKAEMLPFDDVIIICSGLIVSMRCLSKVVDKTVHKLYFCFFFFFFQPWKLSMPKSGSWSSAAAVIFGLRGFPLSLVWRICVESGDIYSWSCHVFHFYLPELCCKIWPEMYAFYRIIIFLRYW